MEIPGLSIIPILFIVLIIVPGVFAKRFYFLGSFSNQFGAGAFADRIITSIFWGFVIQVVTYLSYSNYFKFTLVDIKESLITCYAALSKNELPPDFDKYNPWMILGYLAASIVLSALCGMIAHTIIRVFRIDIRFPAFRFANQWHYYFTGEILRTKDFQGQRRKIISTSADIILEGGDQKPKMFSGILTQYTISPKTGELETLILTAVRKYSNKDSAFKEIPSDFMIIPYNKIIDLNIRYESPALNNSEKSKQVVTSAISIIVIFSFAIVIVAPWFLGLSFLRTISGIFFSLITWLLFCIQIAYILDKEQREKMGSAQRTPVIAFFIVSLVISILILKLDGIILEAIKLQIKNFMR